MRQGSPALLELLRELAVDVGAAGSLREIQETSSSGYHQLALARSRDGQKENTGKAYSDEYGSTPGHYFEEYMDCEADSAAFADLWSGGGGKTKK